MASVACHPAEEVNHGLRYLLHRLAGGIVVLAVTLDYFCPATPRPATRHSGLAGDSASQAQITLLRQQMGLDQPLSTATGLSGRGCFQGDLGWSLIGGRAVSQLRGSGCLHVQLAVTRRSR